MNRNEYNGWTNYETWLVNLWMDNEQGSHEYWREVAEDEYEHAEGTAYSTKEEQARYRLAKFLQGSYDVELALNPNESSVYHDLLGAALSSVNWDEIARHWIDAVIEDLEAAFSQR